MAASESWWHLLPVQSSGEAADISELLVRIQHGANGLSLLATVDCTRYWYQMTPIAEILERAQVRSRKMQRARSE